MKSVRLKFEVFDQKDPSYFVWSRMMESSRALAVGLAAYDKCDKMLTLWVGISIQADAVPDIEV